MICAGIVQVAEQLDFLPKDDGSIPISPLQLRFQAISAQNMNRIVVENHYAHRPVSSSWSWGAYFNGRLLGVISYGKPASPSPCDAVCGSEYSSRVYELNRLWIDDVAPKNSESRFISWTLRQLKNIRPSLILLSYADTDYGHLGIIYSATNWIYTGITKERIDSVVPGHHSRHHVGALEKQKRSIKHRFVYFTDKSDIRYLRWPIVKWSKA